MRALYVVNPHATTTTAHIRDVIAGELKANLDLELVETRHQGHARDLARQATEEGIDLLIALGGDGTINEIVNGVLETPGPHPAVTVVPGGSGNVFARGLGLPRDPVQATRAILERIEAGAEPRWVNLGWVDDGSTGRYFTFNAGFGWDARVLQEVEHQRTAGHKASAQRYAANALRLFLTDPSVRRPTFHVELPDGLSISDVYLTLVTNMSPWTFAGPLAIQPTPDCRLDGGLDAFVLTRIDPVSVGRALAKMLTPGGAPPHGRGYSILHDVQSFTIRASEPSAWHVDGDYLGHQDHLGFVSVAKALQVIA
ncbi:diacylglycerol kinase family lipid kinase [Spiractinospora alimapuensis]|uniref:diacylglycerol/lipid kinase family protein n=1 Tax=Spiractinospora alimapuensis TaxID=2820884 RepID=UPI001F3D50B2|nr:diacylglycerol kinase family protein [Spiractinospora alimapuensis]QVQ54109.1 diacylglycerol kinase family lipid kinase [Spiractinospora alimapuensis]